MQQKIAAAIHELYDLDVEVVLTRPEARFGDRATNVAFQLAKPLGKNPREIAEAIASELRQSDEFADISVAGAGFINLRLSDSALLTSMRVEPMAHRSGEKIVFEYSCPNAFKELHTGHLYQTIFGDIVSNLLLSSGATLQRTSFGGDVGLHVAKCLWGIVTELGGEFPEKLSESEDDAFVRAKWISARYVQGSTAYENDEIAKQSIDDLNKTIYGFHDKDDHTSPLAKIYWETRQWSFDYFDAFYRRIDVEAMRYYPESSTAPVGMAIVADQLEAGRLTRSNGAVVFEGDESKNLHTRVFVTSKGLPTYETKDIGVIWMEKEEYNFDHRYLLTGNDQREYMRVVFAAAETFRPELAGTMTHMTNGTVTFADGKKMSSRLGNVTRALDVVDSVREKVRLIVDDESLVDVVTLGAIKYAFARYRLGGDIAFALDDTVSLQGNSGPYLQYAHARARSILKKANVASNLQDIELDEAERLLVRKLSEYGDVLEQAQRELAPHVLCTYLYELCQGFNRFYEQSRIIGDEREALRVGLVEYYADTLARGLKMLGIHAPDTM